MSGRNAALIAVLGLAAVALVLALYLTRVERPAASPTPTVAAATQTPRPSPSPTPAPTATPTAPSIATAGRTPTALPVAAQTGAISGRLGYPSEFIPPLTVYAISTTDRNVWYSVDFARFPPASGPTPTPPHAVYTITGVAAGTYHVVAYRNDGQRPDPGLYSRYVLECRPGASSAACADHTLIPVTVRAGQTTSGIDVTDWLHGVPGQPAPSIPPRPTPRP